ncbi:PEP-CTERM protein-sorting domain-containing protein/MYXO-CTERM domain-containing protein [Singulisphaera sp. GP187]|uniref:PEP-CTERM sorting domain-containing protein n=1 Tax=Singulisphaera sp. GP187 TaxID=1882752 RepID=UPI0009297735|nr:PEP-CTERM sorting domain-containing protein [Singulisphaera sp. GP187]SIO29512.1 PEP-CTERM protein-sorting domain-containing protein/MYXO-CTERM domain-containing protein [Singulisphaera sp. GP187]
MERSILGGYSARFCLTVALFGATLSPARADNIPAYTVTDLGTGRTQVSADAAGNGIVISPDGQRKYAFPNTPNYLTDQSVLSLLPPLAAAPVNSSWTYGNPANAYSRISGGFLNQNGLYVGTNFVGINGHISAANSLLVASQRQADGSFGPFTTLWTSPYNYDYDPSRMATAKFLNNQNQVLGTGTGSEGNPPYVMNYLYDYNSHTLTNLRDLLPGWIQATIGELGLDDQGRMLLQAEDDRTHLMHSLLLTPAGVTSDPITVPEPTSLATLLLGLGYLAFRRGRRHEEASGEESSVDRLS